MNETTTRAAGTFDIERWEEDVYHQDDGATLSRVVVGKAYHGDMEGRSTTNLLTAAASLGPAAYVGMERFEGALGGRQGTFVLEHHLEGAERGKGAAAVATVALGSGTGELAGLAGKVRIAVEDCGVHRWTLDYELPVTQRRS